AGVDTISRFGQAFNDNRYFHITWLVLPVIGLLERAGLQERARDLVTKVKAATAGRVDSQYNVAQLLEKGDQGVAPNRVEAFKWYMIAARRGDQQALASVQRLTSGLSAADRRTAREAADAFTAPAA
ncbi:5-oxoproline transporter, DUF969 family subunit, partial [Brevundimonas sp. UBA5936]|uniref:5-oxoproline transporter, DUF969 family subunit n=1 Tax=Brevundimonas sp. UBA5936 TaxID=1946133 RepID=UPI0025B8C81B